MVAASMVCGKMECRYGNEDEMNRKPDWPFGLMIMCACLLLMVTFCDRPRAEQLITIRTTPASLLECTAKMIERGDPRALLGPVACAEYSATTCNVILPAGLAAALPLLLAMGPEATMDHELFHCAVGDFHSDWLPWVDR